MGTVFMNYIVMVNIFGLCSFVGVSKNGETAMNMGITTMLMPALGARYLVHSLICLKRQSVDRKN